MQTRTQMQFQWPPFSRSVIGLAILFFVIWIAGVISPSIHNLTQNHMSVSLENIRAGRLWTLLLYGFAHRGFGEVLFVSVTIWFFGAELQRKLGQRTWWMIQITSLLLGGLFVLLWDMLLDNPMPIQGYHAAVIGLITAFCVSKWHEKVFMFTIPFTGKTFLLACIGLSVLMSVLDHTYIRLVLDLAGILSGFFFGGHFFKFRELRTRYRLWSARRKLKLVRGPDRKDYGPN